MASPEYWRRELLAPVRFQQAVESLRENRLFVEVGPGTTLAGLGRQTIHREGVLWATSLRHGNGEWAQMLESLSTIYAHGVDVNWAEFDAPYHRRPVELPTYPFERRRYWLATSASSSALPADERPEWEWISESASRQSDQCRLDLKVDLYHERWACLDKLSSAYIVLALRHLGVFHAAEERHSGSSLIRQNAVRGTYGKLIDRWLRRLCAEGLLQRDGDDFVAPRPLPSLNLAPVLAQAEQIFQGDRIFLEYVCACGEKLTEILTGKESPLEGLFPGGSFHRAEALYQHAPLSAYFSSIARAALEGLVRSRRAGELNVLEIGAGTGGTTASLLPVLPPDRAMYFFTDVSDLFLNRAQEKFANYPFVRYDRFDVESDDATQQYSPGSFDVIVATNVLHATQDVRRTLSTVRSLLAPGGVLILCEVTDYLPWFDITTGLIEGWQRFNDGLRDEHPLLPRAFGGCYSNIPALIAWLRSPPKDRPPAFSASTFSSLATRAAAKPPTELHPPLPHTSVFEWEEG